MTLNNETARVSFIILKTNCEEALYDRKRKQKSSCVALDMSDYAYEKDANERSRIDKIVWTRSGVHSHIYSKTTKRAQRIKYITQNKSLDILKKHEVMIK